MKKGICLCLVLALLVGVLSACGSSSSSSEAEETSEASEVVSEVEESSEEPEAEPEEEPEEEPEAEPEEVPEEEPEAEPEEEPEEAAAPEEPEPEAEEEENVIPGGTYPISMPLTEEGITISFFMRYNPQVQDYVQDMSDNLFYAELEEMSGVTVDFQLFHPSVVEDQFNLQIASQNYCDIYCEYGSNYVGGLDGAVDDEVLLDLSDKIEELMPNYYSFLSNEDDLRAATTDSGRFVAVYQINEPYKPCQTGPLLRADWAEEAGLDVTTMCTYDEYEAYLEYCYNTYGASAYMGEAGVPSFNYLIAGYGVNFDSDGVSLAMKDQQVYCTLLDDGMRDYLNMVSEWYANGWIYQDFYGTDVSLGGGADEGLVLNNETSLWWGEQSYITQYEGDSSDPNFRIAAVQDAVKNPGDETHFGQTNFDRVSSMSYLTVSTACENLDIVMQWMDYRYTQEGYLLGNYGIEGLTYTFDENGQPQYTDMIVNNEEGMTTTLAQWRYMLQNTACLTSVDASNQGLSDYELEASEIWMTNKDNSWSIPDSVSLTTEESETFNSLASDLNTYITTAFLEFIIGSRSVEDDYDEFVETILDMGIEQCVDIYQDALDRYYSK